MSITPLLKTPFTDASWILAPTTYSISDPDSFCSKLKLKYLDCLEAYGMRGGKTKCRELFYDVCECSSNTYQRRRADAIRRERMKQYREGKLSEPFPEYPPLDSYFYM